MLSLMSDGVHASQPKIPIEYTNSLATKNNVQSEL